jgi:hypothetical protein
VLWYGNLHWHDTHTKFHKKLFKLLVMKEGTDTKTWRYHKPALSVLQNEVHHLLPPSTNVRNVKVKLSLCTPWKPAQEMNGQLHLPPTLPAGKNPMIFTEQEVGWALEPVQTKSLAPARNWSTTPQSSSPQPTNYTSYAILTHKVKNMWSSTFISSTLSQSLYSTWYNAYSLEQTSKWCNGGHRDSPSW